MANTTRSLQCSALFHSCQPTTNSATNGIAVIAPVRKRWRFSFSTGWTSSTVGAIPIGGRNPTPFASPATFSRVRSSPQDSEKQCTTAVGCLRCILGVRSTYAVEVKHGDRHREVVQRRQGLRVHHARRARQGPLRPFLRDRGRRLPHARRGRPGLV